MSNITKYMGGGPSAVNQRIQGRQFHPSQQPPAQLPPTQWHQPPVGRGPLGPPISIGAAPTSGALDPGVPVPSSGGLALNSAQQPHISVGPAPSYGQPSVSLAQPGLGQPLGGGTPGYGLGLMTQPPQQISPSGPSSTGTPYSYGPPSVPPAMSSAISATAPPVSAAAGQQDADVNARANQSAAAWSPGQTSGDVAQAGGGAPTASNQTTGPAQNGAPGSASSSAFADQNKSALA